MTDTGGYTRAPEPVFCPDHVAAPGMCLPLPVEQASAPGLLADRVEALERLVQAQARDMAVLRRNDARLTQENIALRHKVNGTGGRAWEGQPSEW